MLVIQNTCVLTEKMSSMLTDNLRDDYIENKCSLDVEEWPPNQPKTVVNVALIHYKGSRTEQELIEISERHKEGTPAVDKLTHHSRVTKDISKIFQTDFTNFAESKPLKLILIEGAPGIGKTVLAKKVSNLWAKKELLTDVNILFLLFLRDPDLQRVNTTEQLVQYLLKKYLDEDKDVDDEDIKNCVKQIKELQVGIVADGFDEYPIELRKRSFIAKLIKGKVFHNLVVVLTSRPTATIKLHDIADRRVEILGFAQEDRDKYISDSLDSPKQIKLLQDYLKCQPIINGLVYVPLHLAVLLYLFKIQSKLPETLTEMNELFILHTIYRSLAKDELIADNEDIDSIEDLPKSVASIVKGLSKLAFMGLHNDQLVFSLDEIIENCPEIKNNIPGAFNGFGLLQAIQHYPKQGLPGTTVSFNFLHFTMQEFLAAFHVSDVAVTPYEQQLLLMEKTFWNSMYNFMWMMYVGINGINSKMLMKFLYKAQPGGDIKQLKLSNDVKSDKIKCLYLLQCFTEAKCKEIPKEISSIFFDNEIKFNKLQLLPHHISSLTLYISKYSMRLQSLNLRDCHIGDVGMSILKHYFTVNPDKASTIKHIDLFGNNSILLWNVYCVIFGEQNLSKLTWSSLGGVDIEEIITVMDNNTTVQSLNISNNHFKNDDAERLAEVLTSNTTLQELDFSQNDITTRGALAISKCLCNNAKLQHLKMSWSNLFLDTGSSMVSFTQARIKDIDVEIVANVLCKNEIVTKLDLSRNRITDNGAESISKCIESNRSITKVDLSRNKISDVGIKNVAVALKLNQAVQNFDISHNNVSDDGVVSIIDSLKDNTTLQQLNMSHNKISDGIINIGKVLKMNKTLQTLDISNNNISDEGVIAIGKALRNYCEDYSVVTTNEVGISTQNCMLQKLNISCNSISHEGILALSTYLKSNNVLQELTISWNECETPLTLNSTSTFCSMSKLHFGDVGTALISAFLFHNLKIQNLDISFNDISDDGAVTISEYLEYNTLLQELNISHNEITNDGIIKILRSINSNSSLCILNLIYNVVTKSGLMMICDICEKLTNASTCTFHISYNKISDNFQDIDTILVHFDNEHDKDIQSTMTSGIKLSMQNRKATYKAKVWCFCAKENSSVKALDISNHDITGKEAKVIAKAIQGNIILKKLDISHNSISDDGVVAISEYLKSNNTLQELNVSYNEISNNGIINIGKALQVNIMLQILDISHNNILDDGVVAIGKVLQSNYVITTNETVTNQGSTQNCILQILDISYNKISSKGIVALGKCLRNNSTLQKLTISRSDYRTPLLLNGTEKLCDLSKKCLENNEIILVSGFLFHNDKVQILDLSHNNISDDGAVAISEYLKANTTLIELNISKNSITSYGIIKIVEAIKANTTLSLLDVSMNNLDRSTEVATALSNHLKHNNTLQILGISWNDSDTTYVYAVGINNECYVDNVWPKSLRTMSGMVHYVNDHRLGFNQSSSSRANHLNKMQVRCKLQFSDTEGIILAALVQGSVNKQTIKIARSKISDNATTVISNCLKTNKILHKLEFSHNIISSRAVKQIMKAIQINTTLQILDVSHNKICDDGAGAISECLKDNNNILQQLHMSHNQVSDFGITKISEALQLNTSLQILDISHNIICNDGAIAIIKSLKYYESNNKVTRKEGVTNQGINCTLQKLDISYNNVSSHGIIALSKYLKTNETLQTLTVSWKGGRCPIVLGSINTLCSMCNKHLDNSGAILISAFLSRNHTLQKLNISRNNISNDGAGAISEYLKLNKTLKELNVSNNKIKNHGIIKIARAIKVNTTLRLLNISHNKMSRCREIVTDLRNCLEHNSTLQVLGISWNSSDDIYVYNIDGITNRCFINSKWPQFNWAKNTVNNVHEYGFKKLDHRSRFFYNTAVVCKKFDRLHFSDTEVILLMALAYKNFDVTTIEIKNSEISSSTALVINNALETSKTVEDLILSQNAISNEALKQIMKTIQTDTTLQILDISHNSISDDGAVSIGECLKDNNVLQQLCMSYNEVSNSGIATISKALQINTFLQILDISHNNISDEGVVAVSEFLKINNTLQQLNMSHNEISTSGIVHIGKSLQMNTTLQVLNISHNRLSGNEVLAFSECLKNKIMLHRLTISWNDIGIDLNFTNVCMSFSIGIFQNQLDDAGVTLISAFLYHNTYVEVLQISNNEISHDGAEAIGECLKTNKTLRQLKISSNKVSNVGTITIGKALQINTTLQMLDISHNNISDDGVLGICECLKSHTLQEFNISYNRISNIGISSIVKALQINTVLQILDISNNNISDDGVRAIGKSLESNNIIKNDNMTTNKRNSTLKVLNMSYNNVSSKGIATLSKSLKSSTTLRRLIMSWNDRRFATTFDNTGIFCDMVFKCLGNTGAILISAFLYQNDKIQILDLSHNNISDDGAVAISEYLKANKTLEKLDMSNNKITNHGIIKIAEVIKVNTSLKLINVSKNNTSRSTNVAATLSDCLRCNNTLQILGISWKDTDSMYVYTVGINNVGCVGNIWPQHRWTYDIVNYVSAYDSDNFDECFISRGHNLNRLQFSETEAILLTSLVYGNINVKTIKIVWSDITDGAAAIISGFLKTDQTLNQFKISETAISSNAIKQIMEGIKTNATLQILNLSLNNISDDGAVAIIECLKNNKTLQKLDLSYNDMCNIQIDKLQMHTVLQTFDISHNNISQNETITIGEFLRNNKTLQRLNMSYNQVYNIGIIKISEALKVNATLQILDISYNNLSDEGALAISECFKSNYTLQELYMSHNGISDVGIINISKCLHMNATLLILDISKNNISDNGIFDFCKYLKENNTLQQLMISWNNIHLNLNSTITSFRMFYNQYGNTGANLISAFYYHNTNMEELDISSSGLTNDGAASISECLENKNTLKQLNMSYNEVSNIGIIYIINALQINVNLQILDVSRNSISDNGAIAIGEYLESNSTLQQLNMSHNQVSNNGMIKISKALQKNAALQVLIVSDNDISDDGAMAIGETLGIRDNNIISTSKGVAGKDNAQNCTLNTLYMSCNNVSSEGIVALSNHLKNNKALQEFTISWNDNETHFSFNGMRKNCNMSSSCYGITGIFLLSSLLSQNDSIQTLDLSHSNISDEEAIIITKYLKTNRTLKELNMSSNDITSYGIIRIAEAIEVNNTLSLLNVTMNKVAKSKDVVASLSYCLKRNKTLQVLGISWNDTYPSYIYTIGTNNECCVDGKWPKSKWIDNMVCYVCRYSAEKELDQHFDNVAHLLKLCDTEVILLTALMHNNVNAKAIDIVGSEISDSAAIVLGDFLKTNETIQKMTVSHSTLSVEAIKQIMKAIQINTTLEVLEISSCNLSDDAAVAISEYLKHNRTLKVLNIVENHITKKGAKFFADYIQPNLFCCNSKNKAVANESLKFNNEIQKFPGNMQVNTALQRLDISHNFISDDGGIIIGECLKLNSTLEELYLSDNKITSYAIIEIAEAIKINTTLQKLDVSHNNMLSLDGVTAINECLKVNKTLKELDLSWNKITNNGVVTIAKTLQANLTLQKLNISHNNISRSIVTSFSGHLNHNSTLKELIISWNDSSTTYIYRSTIKCNVHKICPYSIRHDHHTQCIERTYNPAMQYSDNHLLNVHVINDTHNKLQFSDTEAILLISLVNINVERLEILWSKVSDSAAEVIGHFLKTDNVLKEFTLSQNEISDEGIRLIMKAIQNNNALKILDISSNDISDDGIVAISECLTKNNTLQELRLSWDSIATDLEGITKIAKAVAINKSLHTLDLSSQYLNDPVYFTMTLLTAMEHNHTMMRLVLPKSVKIKSEK